MIEDEMVGWHHRLYRHEFERALGVGEGQESLVCCSPWGHKELDMTEQLNNKVHRVSVKIWGKKRVLLFKFLKNDYNIHTPFAISPIIKYTV